MNLESGAFSGVGVSLGERVYYLSPGATEVPGDCATTTSMGIRRGTRRGLKLVASHLEARGVRTLDRVVSRLSGVPIATEPRALFKKAVQLADRTLGRVEHVAVEPASIRLSSHDSLSEASRPETGRLVKNETGRRSASQLRDLLEEDVTALNEPSNILILLVKDSERLFAAWNTEDDGKKTLELIEEESGQVCAAVEVSGAEGRHFFESPGGDREVFARLSGPQTSTSSNRTRTTPVRKRGPGTGVFVSNDLPKSTFPGVHGILDSAPLQESRPREYGLRDRARSDAVRESDQRGGPVQLGRTNGGASSSYFRY